MEEGSGAQIDGVVVPDEAKLGPRMGSGHREFSADVQADEVRIAVTREVARGALVDPAAHAVGAADEEVRPLGLQGDDAVPGRPMGHRYRPAVNRRMRGVFMVEGVKALAEGPRVLRTAGPAARGAARRRPRQR